MDWKSNPHRITTIEALKQIYGAPGTASILKEVDYIHPHYRTFIEAAPFMTLATSGPNGLDVSPRGDPAGFVVVEDEKTLLIPDRSGNNRIDSLRNIVSDPRVALLFLIPGIGETLRVNGHATILNDPALLSRFLAEGKQPRTVLAVHVEAVFFQRSRAILKSRLWEIDQQINRPKLPSLGKILDDLGKEKIDDAK